MTSDLMIDIIPSVQSDQKTVQMKIVKHNTVQSAALIGNLINSLTPSYRGGGGRGSTSGPVNGSEL